MKKEPHVTNVLKDMRLIKMDIVKILIIVKKRRMENV